MKKIKVGVLFGGQSAEHEVSLVSARHVVAAMDQSKYDISLIGISHRGEWLLAEDKPKALSYKTVDEQSLPLVTLDYTGCAREIKKNESGVISEAITELDVIFPVLHGPHGEDGTVQGLFELANVPYVGCGVAASAVAMDKVLAKQAFKAADIPQTDFQAYRHHQWLDDQPSTIRSIEQRFDYPLFIKPANMGSSVGITKAHDQAELVEGVEFAFNYDLKIIIEESAEGFREVECAVLGNESPQASVVGEIIPGKEFYDYETKYIDDKSELIIPADMSRKASDRIRNYAVEAFQAIDGSGLARVDFFISKDGQTVYINEVNTMPGFTPISMYPKLWQASGVEYADLIDKLIAFGMEKANKKQKLKMVI